MDEAEKCDRIAIIDHGRIVALDSPGGLKSALGGDLITLSTTDGDAVVAELRQRYGIAALASDGRVSFQVARGEAFLPDFVRSFGQTLQAISLRRPTLDDVFLHLTGHEIRDPEASNGNLIAAGGRR